MITEERTLLNLTAEVTNTHRSLQGMPAQTAELQYVNQARHLENYGIEYYSAKVGGPYIQSCDNILEQTCFTCFLVNIFFFSKLNMVFYVHVHVWKSFNS